MKALISHAVFYNQFHPLCGGTNKEDVEICRNIQQFLERRYCVRENTAKFFPAMRYGIKSLFQARIQEIAQLGGNKLRYFLLCLFCTASDMRGQYYIGHILNITNKSFVVASRLMWENIGGHTLNLAALYVFYERLKIYDETSA